MREVTYRRKQSLEHRRKLIAISEHGEDKDCRTFIRKSFIYHVTRTDEIAQPLQQPQIHIHKQFDSKSQLEKFSFRVRGYFYLAQDRSFLRVDFCHHLRIHIFWKTKIFSPKKSATLT